MAGLAMTLQIDGRGFAVGKRRRQQLLRLIHHAAVGADRRNCDGQNDGCGDVCPPGRDGH